LIFNEQIRFMGFMEHASFLDSSNTSWQVHDILIELWGARIVLKNSVVRRQKGQH
jgi:hypothetical protein